MPRRLPDRPRKASAWSGNQRPNYTSHKKTVDKMGSENVGYGFYLNLNNKVDWSGCARLLRDKRVWGDPQAHAEG
ncbi:hypothetical protein [Bacillus sp. B4EP4a]|uniref:hypothetical protein n=1 Tax=Bacillus sp. B4EP4a TaxID=2590665 RepID=UPI00114DF388|nr:hypothetical protein [Bacillus sp. B4EP4a]